MSVTCQLTIPPLADANEELTVGRKFFWDCEGNFEGLQLNSAELRLDPADKFKLHILSTEMLGESKARFTMVSYQAGQHDLKAVQLVDSERSLVLGDLKLEVRSVIQNQEQPEPFGPFGPFQLELSAKYYLGGGILLLTVILALVHWIRKRKHRKLELENVKGLDRGLSPIAQLQKDLRLIQRELGSSTKDKAQVRELRKAFEIFLSRQLLFWACDLPNKQILKKFKARHKKLYRELAASLSLILQELTKAASTDKELSHQDLEQMIKELRNWSENLQQKTTEGIGK